MRVSFHGDSRYCHGCSVRIKLQQTNREKLHQFAGIILIGLGLVAVSHVQVVAHVRVQGDGLEDAAVVAERVADEDVVPLRHLDRLAVQRVVLRAAINEVATEATIDDVDRHAKPSNTSCRSIGARGHPFTHHHIMTRRFGHLWRAPKPYARFESYRAIGRHEVRVAQ